MLEGGREPHLLFLVELRVLERGQALDLVQQRRGQSRLLDEEPLGENGVDLVGVRLRAESGSPGPRWEAGPGCRVRLVLRHAGRAHSDHLAVPGGFSHDSLCAF
jgi:hypothetical protein